jgi:hypothetical protein
MEVEVWFVVRGSYREMDDGRGIIVGFVPLRLYTFARLQQTACAHLLLTSTAVGLATNGPACYNLGELDSMHFVNIT